MMKMKRRRMVLMTEISNRKTHEIIGNRGNFLLMDLGLRVQ
jgi:hypothetical protein